MFYSSNMIGEQKKIFQYSTTSITFYKDDYFWNQKYCEFDNFLDFILFCKRALQKNSCQTIRRALKSHGKKMGEDQYSSSECPLGKTLAIFGFSLFSRKKSRLGCKEQKLDILFSLNHNIHKSSCGHCFWSSDPLIDRFY